MRCSNPSATCAVKIFATDISERDIEQARLGIYTDNKYSTVPESYRHYFSRSDSGHQISKSIRDLVIFARHDVTADPPFSQLDLISCRNLLIYLGPDAQERVIPTFHYALRPQGYLLLGSSESIGSATDLFAAVDKKHKIFVKKPGTRRTARARLSAAARRGAVRARLSSAAHRLRAALRSAAGGRGDPPHRVRAAERHRGR